MQAEVRQLATAAELPNNLRRDSQGICFLGKVRFEDFVQAHLGKWIGPLVDEDTNEVVGYHDGFWFYTLGQRKGIFLSGGPWYASLIFLLAGKEEKQTRDERHAWFDLFLRARQAFFKMQSFQVKILLLVDCIDDSTM